MLYKERLLRNASAAQAKSRIINIIPLRTCRVHFHEQSAGWQQRRNSKIIIVIIIFHPHTNSLRTMNFMDLWRRGTTRRKKNNKKKIQMLLRKTK